MTKPLLIYNPSAGRGLSRRQRSGLARALLPFGGRLATTVDADQARRLTRRAIAEGTRLVLVAGGDGSVRNLTRILASEPACRMGIIPVGTSNNLAVSLGLPRDPLLAFETAMSGRELKMDLGRAGSTLFMESVGMGYLARAWSRAPRHEPESRLRRYLTGIEAALTALRDYRPLSLVIEFDGQSIEREVWNVTVANAPFVANNLPVSPAAQLDDGRLDLFLFPAVSRLKFVAHLPGWLLGNQPDLPGTFHTKTGCVRLIPARPAPARIDNSVRTVQNLTVQVAPEALRVMVPPSP